jgi:hypothetical protein
MTIGQEIIRQLTSSTGKTAALSVLSAGLGWIGSSISGWWKSRDRYQAHVTWQMTETVYGPQEMPVIVIQSVHNLPINVTWLRVRNGFRWKTGDSAFYSDDGEGPQLPRQIPPMESTRFWLDEGALNRAAKQSRLLNWLWVPRLYIGVQTMGRGERLFVAERGLDWNTRRKRYRR